MVAQNPKTSGLVKINETEIYYEVHGSGKPLILLHGYFQSSRSWKPFISSFEEEYEVYLIDLPGHGKSQIFKE